MKMQSARGFALVTTAAGLCNLLCVSATAQDMGDVGQTVAIDVLPYAGMSSDAYNDQAVLKIPGWKREPYDWTTIFKNAGIADRVIKDAANSGFYAAIYRNESDKTHKIGERVIAFRGTNGWTDSKGIATDIRAQLGALPKQYEYAQDLTLLVKQKFPTVSVTGQSLGGGLATYVGEQIAGINRIVAFNPARPPFVTGATGIDNRNQINVVVAGELIGDPSTKSWFGSGTMPGKTYYIHSTTADTPSPNSTPLDNAKSLLGDLNGAHSQEGIIGGLCNLSPSSCPSRQPTTYGQQTKTDWTGIKPERNVFSTPANPSHFPPPSSYGAADPSSSAPVAPRSNLPTIVTNQSMPGPLSQTAQLAPGGISLSKAAAARMPLNIGLDGAYYKDGEVVLTGRYDREHSMDAALLLTAIRLACESDDPYFSLDPLNGAAWLNEGQNASKVLWERIKDNFKSHPAANATRQTKPVLEFRTVSARHDYPALWASLAPGYPNLKSKLVFKPEWLRETRFGEVLYKGDVLLKELAYGVPILQEGELRAGKIDRYVTAGYRNAAKGLLAQLEGAAPSEPEWRGSRLWFDLTSERVSPQPTPANPFPDLVQPYKLVEPIPTFQARLATPRELRQWKRDARRSSRTRAVSEARHESKGGSSGLRELLRARNFIENVSAQPVPVVAVKKDGNTLDLSEVYPHMFIRRHNQATGQDIPGSDPALDDLATDVNQRVDRYVNAYTELGVLADLFRAYVVAVQMMKDARPLCARIQAMPLLDAEKAVVPLPKEHPSELFITIGSYEFTDGNLRRLFAITGQSINGGVSISGRSLYATAVKFAPTLITQMMDQALSRRADQAEWQVSDRRFIAFNIESGLPVAESQPYLQSGLHTKQSEISGSGAMNMLLRGSFLLGVFSLFWYAFADSFSDAYSFVAGIPRKARFGKNQKVKNIPTNANGPDNKGRYSDGMKTGSDYPFGAGIDLWHQQPTLITQMMDQALSRRMDKADIESEFKKVFADETDEYREQLIAQRKKLSGCNRREAMRRAIMERPNRAGGW